MKIVINTCYGCFGLSEEACKLLNIKNDYKYTDYVKRGDPKLVEVVEKLGEKANGNYAKLEIVEVEGRFKINYYDGMESIIELGYEKEDKDVLDTEELEGNYKVKLNREEIKELISALQNTDCKTGSLIIKLEDIIKEEK